MIPSKNAAIDFSWWQVAKAIWFLLEQQRKKFLFFTIVIIVIQFWNIFPALIIGKIIDFFTHYKPGTSLVPFFTLAFFLTIATSIIALIRLTTKNKLSNISNHMNYNARVKGFERLLEFSLLWHDKENSGNRVQKIQSGTNALRQLQLSLNNDIYGNVTTLVGVLIAYIIINPLFFVIALVYFLIFLAVQMRFYNTLVRQNDTYFELIENASGVYYEGLSNVLTLKTLGVKNDFKKSITSREQLARDHGIQMAKTWTNKWKAFQLVNAFFILVVLLLIGRNFIVGAITIGSIFVLYNYFSSFQDSIGGLTNLVDSLVSYKAAIARMMPIYWDQLPIRQGNEKFPKNWKEIVINNAVFDYKAEVTEEKHKPAALQDITITINKNEKIGIVGKSGSGKSTFAKMLLGLYEFNTGAFTIGGKGFYDLQHDEITKHIALILQESEMFNMSLKDNITLMREFDEKLFQKAIEISQLEELIANLPEGIETMIGEKGYRLSGGERQRIGIARAIYKDPEILVMDEATSSLDTKTESLIQQAMEEKLQEKTVIMIAHRVSTLKNVDKIYVFADGKIVESGKFDTLAKDKKSKFFEVSQYQKKTS